jgi:hypothetical protein
MGVIDMHRVMQIFTIQPLIVIKIEIYPKALTFDALARTCAQFSNMLKLKIA